MDELEIPDDITGSELSGDIKQELRTLPEGLAKFVAKNLVAAGRFIDSDPEKALLYAKAANVAAASRLAIVREAVGVAAYRCQDFKYALSELKAARRISGKPDTLSLIADCERALNKPEKAIEILNEKDIEKMDRSDFHELMITVVGARKDLGQKDAGLALAKIKEFNSNEISESIANMRYVYAQTLQDLGRIDEAKVWFEKTLICDPENLTGAREMLEKCQ